MRRYILNSAVITSPGTYEYNHISVGEAISWLSEDEYESTVGYKETAEALQSLTGFEIGMNRKQITMNVDDEALVFRLTRRLTSSEIKGAVGLSKVIENSELGILKRIR